MTVILLKGHGHNFSEIFFSFFFYCFQYLRNTFLMINQNMSGSSRYKQDTEFTIFCFVNKFHAMFLFTFVWCTGNRSFSTRLFYLLIGLNINNQFPEFVTFILGINLGKNFQQSKCIRLLHIIHILVFFINYNFESVPFYSFHWYFRAS